MMKYSMVLLQLPLAAVLKPGINDAIIITALSEITLFLFVHKTRSVLTSHAIQAMALPV